MMTICDIYDAMTAADRPYKLAISHSEALGYLAGQATEGKIDSALFDLFQKERVYEATLVRPSKIA
jgi:3',5'-cyclic-nucleotide phosphodiesterase